MACRYPDARSPAELWENALAKRRAFRRVPPQRLRLEDYLSGNRHAPDALYPIEAAVIEGYEFDRIGFRVAGSTFRSADLAHWMALDIAAKALDDAGFAEGAGLPRETTGVILGNTLTGEFSRANLMRLRWPYVRRVVEAALTRTDWSPEQRRGFLEELESDYKAPFPPVGEETLAGGLSNTIAGRICNYFDLKGGGYTVDGACASSLLAIATACSALSSGDLDVAIAGGVDLSLDPFELVGFAKTSALTPDDMRVYDSGSSGFWPGEGCGFVTLMRHEDAIAQRCRVYAVIRGWGVSSDGEGGITRPEVEGQILALQRAYRRAGFGIDTVSYFEGHGTGTSVGDTVELRALARARREAEAAGPPAVISSIKANIGHTKAAAGVAGLIKAAMALHTQVLPPATGCLQPHPELIGDNASLRVLNEASIWPPDRTLRCGVSAMGFGGINTHIAIESTAVERRRALSSRERAIIASPQDAELFLLCASNPTELRRKVEQLLEIADKLSRAEIADLAAELAGSLNSGALRAAIVASTPAELASRLDALKSRLAEGLTSCIDVRSGVFLSDSDKAPRIGLLFTGQGAPAHLNGGVWPRRFAFVKELYAGAVFSEGDDGASTETAQPAIITASLGALRVLKKMGIDAAIAVGHSLGEITALHWAGGFDEESLLRIAIARGKAMASLTGPAGAMASIRAEPEKVEALLNGDEVAIACFNAPQQTTVSGESKAISHILARFENMRVTAVKLPVSHAFHSPQMKGALPALRDCLRREEFYPLNRLVVSTVTGELLSPVEDIRQLLLRQLTSPVKFAQAAIAAARGADLLIEVGPGEILSGLVSEFIDVPAVSLDAGGPSLKGLLTATGAAFALGASINHSELFAGRFARPFSLDWQPRFFANPCEMAPVPETSPQVRVIAAQSEEAAAAPELQTVKSTLELIQQLVAERAELPASLIKKDDYLLSDLHLNSITVSQLVVEAARRLGLRRPASPLEYASATVGDIAQALDDLSHANSPAIDDMSRIPAGVDSWIRTFSVEMAERPLPRRRARIAPGPVRMIAPPEHPFASELQAALDDWEGGGAVVVCLPPDPDERHIELLLQGARAVFEEAGPGRFVLVQHGGGAASFARTLHLETRGLTTCVVDVPAEARAVEWVLAEIRAAIGYSEAHYDTAATRREPVLRLLGAGDEARAFPLGAGDVLLVTGGGKGITAECAIMLAREKKVRLILFGLSQPDSDAELASNLARMSGAGIEFLYLPVDITDAAAVRSAVEQAVKAFGPVTGVLHGAALNVPQSLRSIDEELFHKTVATKLQGARNVLAAVDTSRLKTFTAFSSIIARTGLPGESHYGLANEWLTRLTGQFRQDHPACRCLAIEWSVWSGVGMAQRIGGIGRLVDAGITPITPDEGVSLLRRLMSQDMPAASVVVMGRYGDLPTLKFERPELPLLRFLENVRVYYPGVELIADVQLSADTDPYLIDHAFQGERLVPAVMGLEAMAEVAMALSGSSEPPNFETVEFARAIAVPEGKTITIRVAALLRQPDRVEVAVRSEGTGFQVDHFRAVCSIPEKYAGTVAEAKHPAVSAAHAAVLPLDPERDLYGNILFHKGRFQRLRSYRILKATECLAEITPNGTSNWFGRYLPSALVLGDPAMRDAAIHAIQSCIPHAVLLPVGVERILSRASVGSSESADHLFVHARERKREGDVFTYDFELIKEDGAEVERWEGIQLRVVSGARLQGEWAEPLLSTYVERRVGELIPGAAVSIAVERDIASMRRARADQVIQRAVGQAVSIVRRFDGKPEVAEDTIVSATHCGDLTVAVAGRSTVSCDLEQVSARPAAAWGDLLGPRRVELAEVIAQETGERLDVAATRVWTATECLKKVGASYDAPLVLASSTSDGWVLLSAGPLISATYVARVRGFEASLALSVLVRRDDAGL
jgi:enediyne polyketide synthase